jgi:hypothetical protein
MYKHKHISLIISNVFTMEIYLYWYINTKKLGNIFWERGSLSKTVNQAELRTGSIFSGSYCFKVLKLVATGKRL